MKKLFVMIMVVVTMLYCTTAFCQTSNFDDAEIYLRLMQYIEKNEPIFNHYKNIEVDEFGVYCDWSILHTDYLLETYNIDWYNDGVKVFSDFWKQYIIDQTGVENVAVWVNKVDEYEGIEIYLMGVCADHDLNEQMEGDQCAVELLVGVNK